MALACQAKISLETVFYVINGSISEHLATFTTGIKGPTGWYFFITTYLIFCNIA